VKSLLKAACAAALLASLVAAPAEAQLRPGDPRAVQDQRDRAIGIWYGRAAEDGILRDIATQPWNANWGDTFGGITYSGRVTRFWTHFTLDGEVGAGYRSGTDTPEAWGAFYVRFDGFPWRDTLLTSFGLSTGLHWINRLPEVETGTAARPEPNRSKVLHFFSPEIAFALPSAPQHEVAIRYAHRSGIFGSFNGVWEGSNVLMIGYRYRF